MLFAQSPPPSPGPPPPSPTPPPPAGLMTMLVLDAPDDRIAAGTQTACTRLQQAIVDFLTPFM